MFQTLSDHHHKGRQPGLMGVTVGCAVLLCLSLAPYLFEAKLDLLVKDRRPWRVVHLTSARLPKPMPKPGTRAATGTTTTRREDQNAIIIRPGTPLWRSHAQRGQHLGLEIHAKNSLPVLRANGVKLALDNHRPRGQTSIFDLATLAYAKGPVPDEVVVRELTDMPQLEGFAEAFESKERETGTRVTIFALYPESLYAALASIVYEALERDGISPGTVRRADVELRPAGGQSFTVRLLAHS